MMHSTIEQIAINLKFIGIIHSNTKQIANNSSPPGEIGRHFADDIFRCLFMNEKFCDLIKIALKFVLKGPIDSNPALILLNAE